ncbi:hypothetical protein C1646_756801 [Rhizophagus diaphanus]|nr:hypothetical protein C1646_756801 [Rhizophagus diaphanus] [Rhizophagus sp. MUCL 43196]
MKYSSLESSQQAESNAYASLQCNCKKYTYDDVNLYEGYKGAINCIISMGIDWVIKVQSGIEDRNDNGDENPIKENSKRKAESIEYKNSCSVGEDISLVTAVSQPDAEPECHIASNDIPNPVIDQCVSIAKQHVADNSNIKLIKKRETNAFLGEVYKKSVSNDIREVKNIAQDIFDFTITLTPEKNHMTEISMTEETCNAEKQRIRVNQDKILYWYDITKFDNQVKNIIKTN